MSGPISTRNGVPTEPTLSDPPGGIPLKPDPLTTPHPVPTEGEPAPMPGTSAPLVNEPPLQPPAREAKRSRAK